MAHRDQPHSQTAGPHERPTNGFSPAQHGAALDVFGNGRTALKFSLGKYLEGASTGNPVVFYNTNPVLRLPNTNPAFGPMGVQRAWTDANGNFRPDCNLQNPNTQDLRPGGGDFCGQITNLSFGQA